MYQAVAVIQPVAFRLAPRHLGGTRRRPLGDIQR